MGFGELALNVSAFAEKLRHKDPVRTGVTALGSIAASMEVCCPSFCCCLYVTRGRRIAAAPSWLHMMYAPFFESRSCSSTSWLSAPCASESIAC